MRIIRHLGDLGNIEVSNGQATVDMNYDLIKLSGSTSVIGRSIVVSSFTSKNNLLKLPCLLVTHWPHIWSIQVTVTI